MTPQQMAVRVALLDRHRGLLERLGASPELLAAATLADEFNREQIRLWRAWGARP